MPTRNKTKNLRKRAKEFLQKTPSAIRKMPEKDLKDLKTLLEALRHSQPELEKVRDEYLDLYDFAPMGYFTVSGKGII